MKIHKKIHFICFAGGETKFKSAQKRLLSQVNDLNIFDSIIGFNRLDLDNDYYIKFQNLIEEFPKGFGLWSWKPWIIYNELKKINRGDILFYLDVGFEINIKAKSQIFSYIHEIHKQKILVFDNGTKHDEYTKPDQYLLNSLNRNRNQISAAFIALEKCKLSEKIISEWLYLCSKNNGELLKENIIINQKNINFLKHRHDQSILTTVLYNHNYQPFFPDPTYNINWKLLINSPFINFRNYSERSVIHLELMSGLLGFLIKIIRIILLFIRYRKIEFILKSKFFRNKLK